MNTTARRPYTTSKMTSDRTLREQQARAERGSPINWLKVIADASEAKAAQLQMQAEQKG
ncbi:MAG TPA: hypothetical protein VNM48_03780 [Chloroflexota bacterium]|nr:hypothetical protein [Chloroflexota bacterium]